MNEKQQFLQYNIAQNQSRIEEMLQLSLLNVLNDNIAVFKQQQKRSLKELEQRIQSDVYKQIRIIVSGVEIQQQQQQQQQQQSLQKQNNILSSNNNIYSDNQHISQSLSSSSQSFQQNIVSNKLEQINLIKQKQQVNHNQNVFQFQTSYNPLNISSFNNNEIIQENPFSILPRNGRLFSNSNQFLSSSSPSYIVSDSHSNLYKEINNNNINNNNNNNDNTMIDLINNINNKNNNLINNNNNNTNANKFQQSQEEQLIQKVKDRVEVKDIVEDKDEIMQSRSDKIQQKKYKKKDVEIIGIRVDQKLMEQRDFHKHSAFKNQIKSFISKYRQRLRQKINDCPDEIPGDLEFAKFIVHRMQGKYTKRDLFLIINKFDHTINEQTYQNVIDQYFLDKENYNHININNNNNNNFNSNNNHVFDKSNSISNSCNEEIVNESSSLSQTHQKMNNQNYCNNQTTINNNNNNNSTNTFNTTNTTTATNKNQETTNNNNLDEKENKERYIIQEREINLLNELREYIFSDILYDFDKQQYVGYQGYLQLVKDINLLTQYFRVDIYQYLQSKQYIQISLKKKADKFNQLFCRNLLYQMMINPKTLI